MAVAALGAVRGAEQDEAPPVRAVTALAAPSEQRRYRGKLVLGENVSISPTSTTGYRGKRHRCGTACSSGQSPACGQVGAKPGVQPPAVCPSVPTACKFAGFHYSKTVFTSGLCGSSRWGARRSLSHATPFTSRQARWLVCTTQRRCFPNQMGSLIDGLTGPGHSKGRSSLIRSTRC